MASSSKSPVRPSTTFNDLNDFIQRKIFDYLHDFDLCAVADVSTNLKQNAQATFYQRNKSGGCSMSVRGDEERIIREAREMHLHLLPSVLRNFGPLINSLRIALDNSVRIHSQRILELIVCYCSATLDDISLAQFILDNDFGPAMYPLLLRLRKLQLHWCLWTPEFDAFFFFRCAKN